MRPSRLAIGRTVTAALAAFAADLACILVLITSPAMAGLVRGNRPGMAALFVVLAAAVLAGAALTAWRARRDHDSWWPPVRRASAVIIVGTYAVAFLHLLVQPL